MAPRPEPEGFDVTLAVELAPVVSCIAPSGRVSKRARNVQGAMWAPCGRERKTSNGVFRSGLRDTTGLLVLVLLLTSCEKPPGYDESYESHEPFYLSVPEFMANRNASECHDWFTEFSTTYPECPRPEQAASAQVVQGNTLVLCKCPRNDKAQP